MQCSVKVNCMVHKVYYSFVLLRFNNIAQVSQSKSSHFLWWFLISKIKKNHGAITFTFLPFSQCWNLKKSKPKLTRLRNVFVSGSANTTLIQKENKRHFYSIFSLFFQYILPFTIISVVYSLLYCYLKKHRMVRDDKQLARERARRTNIMLAAISVLYCLCWLPLNFFNLLSDLYEGIFEVRLVSGQVHCDRKVLSPFRFPPLISRETFLVRV